MDRRAVKHRYYTPRQSARRRRAEQRRARQLKKGRARGGGFLTTVVAGFASQALLALSGPLLAHMLGPHDRGVVALGFLVAVVPSQLTFGGALPSAIAHQLARHGAAARDGLRRLAPRWILPTCVPAGAAGVVMYFWADGAHVERIYLGVLVFAFSLATIWYSILIGALQGEGSPFRLNAFRIGTSMPALFVLIVGFVIQRRWHPVPILVIYVVTSVLGLVFGWLLLRRPTRHPGDELDGKALWTFARKAFVSTTGPVDGLGVDQLVVSSVLGQTKLGLYVCATALANLPNIVSRGIGLVLLPKVAGAADERAARRVAYQWIRASAMVNLLIIGCVEVVAGPVIRVLFGRPFASAVPCAHVLILAAGVLGFRRVLIAVLQGQNRAGVASAIEGVCLPLIVAATLIGALADGLVGAALGVAAIGILSCTSLAIAMTRWHPDADHWAPRSEQALEAELVVPDVTVG